MSQAYHIPRGFPRCDCGVLSRNHFVEHEFKFADYQPGCERCNMPKENHRSRVREKRNHGIRGNDKTRGVKFIGIDGEGAEHKGLHCYFMLVASYEDGSNEWVARPHPGRHHLTTKQCLDLILELPTRRTKIFAFAFNYDLTKILEDVDNETLYHLFRPELRKRFGDEEIKGPKPVHWEGYFLNLQGTKFTVRRGGKRVVIWDLFKFFQSKFVTALQEWKVGTPELWARMQRMKEKRSTFDMNKWDEIFAYCKEETMCMGQLARKLVDSHEACGLKLTSYYGAGSSGAAMLTVMEIRNKLAPVPPEMQSAVSSAFFGGRFENSVIGDIREPLTNWDIASAYVYQLWLLPCLEHGSWRKITSRKELNQAQGHALVRYTLGTNPRITGWGPFPFRTSDGTISFPIESGGGWIWLGEYLEGERLWPHVHFVEAWIYSSNCQTFRCDGAPFKRIPVYYQERLKIGKEGPGLVLKLGMNSCYGKLAQSVGKAQYNSWIWAGMITSGCRAQLLQLLGMHKDPENVLMLATDGLLTRDRSLIPPEPLATSTGGMFDGKLKSPLGGWEKKSANRGMFIARPGIYFPLGPTEEEIATVRARGVGRSIVLKYWKTIVDVWRKDGIRGVAVVEKVPRFCGAKTSISVSGNHKITYKRANHKDGIKPRYGQWVSREVGMAFDPLPKREGIHKDGLRLLLRRFPKTLESVPYDRAVAMFSPEAQELRNENMIEEEQPNHDITDNGEVRWD